MAAPDDDRLMAALHAEEQAGALIADLADLLGIDEEGGVDGSDILAAVRRLASDRERLHSLLVGERAQAVAALAEIGAALGLDDPTASAEEIAAAARAQVAAYERLVAQGAAR